MAEVHAVSPAWAVVAAAMVCLVAVLAAGLDGALVARREDRGGVAGLDRPLREGVRLLRQRRRTTPRADNPLWRIGATGLGVVALLMAAVVPLGSVTVLDLRLGVVWFNALDVMVWALVWLTGWGANSAYALVGGYRFLAQALGYELPLMFALVAPAVAARSLRVGDIAAAQDGLWFVVWMPVAFAVYCLGVVGFSVRGPLAAAVGADLAGGVDAELSGADRLLFRGGLYALLAAGAAFAVPMFLGGGAGPLLAPWAWVLVKTLLVVAVLVAVRHRVGLLRPDQLVEAAWVLVLPVVIAQDLVVAVVAVATAGRGGG